MEGASQADWQVNVITVIYVTDVVIYGTEVNGLKTGCRGIVLMLDEIVDVDKGSVTVRLGARYIKCNKCY